MRNKNKCLMENNKVVVFVCVCGKNTRFSMVMSICGTWRIHKEIKTNERYWNDLWCVLGVLVLIRMDSCVEWGEGRGHRWINMNMRWTHQKQTTICIISPLCWVLSIYKSHHFDQLSKNSGKIAREIEIEIARVTGGEEGG